MFAPRCAPTHVTPDTPRAFIAYKPRPCNNRCLRQHARILTQPSTPRFCSKSSLWPQAHLKLGCGCVSRSMAKLIFGDFFGAMPREKPSSPCKHPPGVLHLAFSFTGHFLLRLGHAMPPFQHTPDKEKRNKRCSRAIPRPAGLRCTWAASGTACPAPPLPRHPQVPGQILIPQPDPGWEASCLTPASPQHGFPAQDGDF